VFIYLKGNTWVEIPDGTRVEIVGDEFHCLDSNGNLLAKFNVMDVQLYSRIRLRVEDLPDGEMETGLPR
jgi:hypothetical protein